MKFIKRFFGKKDKKDDKQDDKKEVKNCLNCKFNKDLYCSVGSYLAKQGKTGVCYEGELHQSNPNT